MLRILVALGVVLHVAAFFSIKLESSNLSLYFLPMALVVLINAKDLKIKKDSLYAYAFLIAYLILGYLNLKTNEVLVRSMTFFLNIAFFFSILRLIKKSSYLREEIKKGIEISTKILYAITFLGYAQFILSFFGIMLSYESLGEPAPENLGLLGNMVLLRPNSLFGEPRDFAAVMFIILALKGIINKRISRFEWIHLLVMGVLTQSTTFLLALFLALLPGFFSKRIVLNVIFGALASLLVISFVPRIDFNEVEDYGKSTQHGLQQAGDASLPFYVQLNPIKSTLLGNGMGTSNLVITSFTAEQFGVTDLPQMNTRLLPYKFLIEFGVIGSLISVLFFLKFWGKYDIREKKMLWLAICGSLVVAKLYFLYVILLIETERNSEE